MTELNAGQQATVIAVYHDHAAAEAAVRRLQYEGFPIENISIIGKDFQTTEQPLGFVTAGSGAKEGAKFGAWTGSLFGLLVAPAFLILPGVGTLIVLGPLAALLVSGVEGALAGAAFGGLTGVLVGLGMSQDQAIRFEAQITAGKFLVTLQGDAKTIGRAKALFAIGTDESADVFGLVSEPAPA